MDRLDDGVREEINIPVLMYGLIIMTCGAIIYFVSIVGMLLMGSASSISDVSLYFGLSLMNLVGMLMFMFGTVMQVARLVTVLKAIRKHLYLEE